MKLNCTVISDLLPLYAEQLTSEDSRLLVEEHLTACPHCKKQLEELLQTPPAPAGAPIPLLTVNRLLRRHTVLWCVLTGCLIAVLALSVLGWMTSAEGVKYQENMFTCLTDQNGVPYVRVNAQAAEGVTFSVEHFYDQAGRREMCISGYTSPWTRVFQRDQTGAVYAAESDQVVHIYYQEPDGFLRPLYGPQLNGGVMVLPQLALNFYLLAALALGAVFTLLYLCLRRSAHGPTLFLCAAAFDSYVLAHLLIKGFDAETWFLLQDLAFILLTAAAICGAAVSLRELLRLQTAEL